MVLGASPAGLSPGFREDPPHLAIQIVSPGDSAVAVNAEVAEYLDASASHLWTVWPDSRSITVHRPDGSAMTYTGVATLSSDALGADIPGFELTLRSIFPPRE